MPELKNVEPRRQSGTGARRTVRFAVLAAAGGLTIAVGGITPAGAAAPPSSVPSVRAGKTSVQAGAHQASLVAGEDARLIAVRTALSHAPTGPNGLKSPFRIASGSTYTLVLTARQTPYTLADLVRLEPQTLTRLPDTSFLIGENVVVADGATLALGGKASLTVRLQSDASMFTSIVSLGGRLQLKGTAAAPLRIASWDPSTRKADGDLTDGRAYVRSVDGTTLIDHVAASDLGFWSGRTGGIALTASDQPDTGVVGSQTGSTYLSGVSRCR